MIRFSELSCKDVINVRDGSRLGHIQDLDINLCSGEICAVMVPECTKFFGFLGGQNEYWIEWKQICKIGEDIILVDIEPSRCLKECRS